MSIRFISILILLLAIAMPMQLTAQQNSDSNGAADRIMSGIMSPYCPGRLLRDCPSGQALQLKDKILTRLKAGESEQLIIEDLIATFGEEVRAAPRARGFGLVAWLAPSLFLIGGALLTILWLRRRSLEPEDASPLTELDPAAEERIAELLDKR